MGNLFSYAGKRVVVTGGATGIGAALVSLLKDLGAAHVTVLDIKQPEGPVDAFIEVNLADKASLDAAVAQIEGPVDVLFSNAGVAARSGVRTCLAVNVAASRRLTDAVLPLIPPTSRSSTSCSPSRTGTSSSTPPRRPTPPRPTCTPSRRR